MGFAPAVGARGCSDGPASGSVDLQTTLLGWHGAAGATSLGIFNCRRIGGPDSAWSVHAEGRALDLGIPAGHQVLGDLVLAQLLRAGDGVLQRIIWYRRCFDLASPDGRPYSGPNPHVDHLHIELSWRAARGEIALGLEPEHDGEDDPMPVLIVAYRGAQWAVSPDLTSRVGLSAGVDVTALLKISQGRAYAPATLSDSLMARIPEVSAL